MLVLSVFCTGKMQYFGWQRQTVCLLLKNRLFSHKKWPVNYT